MKARQIAEWARPFVEQAWRFVKDSAVAVGEALRNFFVQVDRCVDYTFLLIWIIICRAVLFVLTIGPIGFPLALLYWLHEDWETAKSLIKVIEKSINADIAEAFTLLISVGILSLVITTLGKYAFDKLGEIYDTAMDVLTEGWHGPPSSESSSASSSVTSDWKSLEGLRAGWRYYIEEKTHRKALTAFMDAYLLTLALALCLLLIILYPIFAPKQQAEPARNVSQYIAVVGAGHDIELYMRGGAVFSLAHVDDAQPKTGKGICLGLPQQAWLKEFRAAIANCMEDESSETNDTTFKVTGYASIAPMHVDGDIRDSRKLNCKVANWRAAAVGAFLANPSAKEYKKRWNCKHMGNDFNDSPIECGKLTEEPYEGIDSQGNQFFVDVHQWPTYDEMAKGKPADDGARPNDRRFDVEILNRVVHIEVPRDFCRATPAKLPAP